MGGTVESKYEVKVVIDLPVEDWIEGARGGAQEPLGQALEASRAYLSRLAAKEIRPALRPKGDVSDLVQETLLEATRDFPNFTGRTRPEWQSWLRRIFVNNLKGLARAYGTAKRELSREVSLDRTKAAEFGDRSLTLDISSPSSVAMKKERREALEGAIGRLSERDRLLLVMKYSEHCTYEEMGRRLGSSPVAARKALGKAIRRARAEVGASSIAG